MENKTTSELLDLLFKLEKQSESSNGRYDWDKHEEILAELRKREPFRKILGQSDDQNDPTIEEKVDQLLEDVKLLKRHKHDSHSGDVLVRI